MNQTGSSLSQRNVQMHLDDNITSARINSFPGFGWERNARQALPAPGRRNLHVQRPPREAEPRVQCVPRQSLGTRRHSAFRFPLSPRRAFTLYEMLLVLGILLLLASITWPALLRNYGEYRLKRSAEDVRIMLAATRIRAIDRGVVYQFLYEPQGRRYASVPYERTTKRSAGPVFGQTAVDNLPRDSGQLPEGLTFALPVGASAYETAVQSLDIELFAGLPDAQELAAARWGTAADFFPDGNASNFTVRILDAEKSRALPLYVRGLTGAAETGTVDQEAAP